MTNHPNRTKKPKIGDIVLYYQGDFEAPPIFGNLTEEEYKNDALLESCRKNWRGTNGSRWHPAIITRIWTNTCCNLHVFLDANASVIKCSVTQLPQLPEGTVNTSGMSGWQFK